MEAERLLEEAARRIATSKHCVALTGAGISTESGIPDFRGPKGLWRKYDPEDFTLRSFLSNPAKYWRLHLEIFAGLDRAKPNPAHFALAELERLGKLKCVITQNVDGLHQKAGSRHVVELHGNLGKARCLSCGREYPMGEVEGRVAGGENPPKCSCGGLLKPTVVFFEEPLPFEAFRKAEEEALKCDLMLVVGTSAVVYPAAELPYLAKFKFRPSSPLWFSSGLGEGKAAIIEVNMEATPLTGIADLSLFGKAGKILPRLVERVRSMLE